jgi:hypothetical protein
MEISLGDDEKERRKRENEMRSQTLRQSYTQQIENEGISSSSNNCIGTAGRRQISCRSNTESLLLRGDVKYKEEEMSPLLLGRESRVMGIDITIFQ